MCCNALPYWKCSFVCCGPRFLCMNTDALESMSPEYRMGRALGEQQAWTEAQKKYGWRAKLSGGGVTLLVLFLMAVGGGIAM